MYYVQRVGTGRKLNLIFTRWKITKEIFLHWFRYLRQLVISEACELRYSDCLRQATEMYSQVMAADDFQENMWVRLKYDVLRVLFKKIIKRGFQFITACVRSTTGRYCFHRCLSVHGGGGYPSLWSHVLSRGYALVLSLVLSKVLPQGMYSSQDRISHPLLLQTGRG